MTDRRDAQSDELHDLIGAVINRTATVADIARLESIMAANRDARLLYLRMQRLHADLCAPSAVSIRGAVPVAPSPVPTASTRGPQRFRIAPVAWSLAAALLLTAAAVAIYLIATNTQSKNRRPIPDGPPIATLIDSTGTLLIDNEMANPGSVYASGVYSLTGGEAEFLLTNRVGVTLRGETRLVVNNPMRVKLEHGTASFHVPADAAGFTLNLPDGSRVVDLGTAFRVSVDDDGRATLRVTEGRVAWTVEGEDVEPVVFSAGQDARLVAGRPTIDPNPGLVAYWPLNDGPVGSAVIGADDRIDDPDHPATDATVEGTGDTWVHDPERGVVLSTTSTGNLFAGTQGIDGDFTWSLWIRTDEVGKGVVMGNRGGAAPWNKLTTIGVNGWARIEADGGDLGISDDRWHHLAVVRTGSIVALYVDGRAVGRDTNVSDDQDGPMRIGGDPIYSERVTARLSDVAIWNHALNPARIRDLAAGAPVLRPAPQDSHPTRRPETGVHTPIE